MIGVVLAAGTGTRLMPLTEHTPKTLLPVRGNDTILDGALANLGAAGVSEVVIVTGYRADAIEARIDDLASRHGVDLGSIGNDRAEEWNNAYSLWLARESFRGGMVLVNGDTVFPPTVIPRLLERAADLDGFDVLLALDDVKALADEEMKVALGDGERVARINKSVDPRDAAGEYIGVCVVPPAAAEPLADALEATWQRDPGLYYEDGFQELIDRGRTVRVAPIGDVAWVEVDDHRDLERAREISCRS